MTDDKLTWWGYLHTSGTIQAKRFFSHDDIQDARESPFVAQVVGPFPANGRDEAITIITNATKKGIAQ